MTFKQRGQKSRAGFTMAELLITVAIILILAGFGFVAVINYQRSLKLKEMDDTARQLFVTAQNHIAAAKADGTWDSIYDSENKKFTTEMGFTHLSPFTPGDDNGQLTNDVKRDFYYVAYSGDESFSTALNILLPQKSIDETIRTGGSYVIEFDAINETVYGVFYTENAGTIGYPSVNDLRTKEGRRTKASETNWKTVIGYYGGVVSGSLEKGAKPTLEFELDNSTTLNLTMQAKQGENPVLIKLAIYGNQSQRKDLFTIEPDWEISTGKFKTSSSASYTTMDDASLNAFKVALQEDKKTVVLDDITKAGSHFSEVLKGFLPGEDITITVTAVAGNADPVSKSITTNSLFDSAKEETAYINNSRHLQNLEPTVSSLADAVLIKNAEQIRTFGWHELFTTNKSVVLADQKTTSYPEQLVAISNPKLESYEGNGFIIRNLYATANNGNAGLFATAGTGSKSMTIQNVFLTNVTIRLSDEKETKTGTVGALVGLGGTNLTIKNCGVYAEAGTTILSGTNATAAQNYLNDAESYLSTGSGFAGGLVGELKTGATIQDSFASVRVNSNSGAAGGLVGRLSSATGEKAQIQNSYAGGFITKDVVGQYDRAKANITSSEAYAGGLVGSVNANLEVTNCFSTTSVAGNKAAGGMTGLQNAAVTYNNCYTVGAVIHTGETATNPRVAGTFVGEKSTSATVTFTNCRTLIGTNLKWYDNLWAAYNPTKEYTTMLPGVGSLVDGKEVNYIGLTETYASGFTGNGSVTQAYNYTTDPYPFPAVNNTYPYENADSKTGTYHYFGDWPVVETGIVRVTKNLKYENTDETLTTLEESVKLNLSETIGGNTREVSTTLANMKHADGKYWFELYMPVKEDYILNEVGRKFTGLTTEVTTKITTDQGEKTFANAEEDSKVLLGFTVPAVDSTKANLGRRDLYVDNTYEANLLMNGPGVYYYEVVNGQTYVHGYNQKTGTAVEVGSVATSGTATEAGYFIVMHKDLVKNGSTMITLYADKTEKMSTLVNDEYLTEWTSEKIKDHNLNLGTDYGIYEVNYKRDEYKTWRTNFNYTDGGVDKQTGLQTLVIDVTNNSTGEQSKKVTYYWNVLFGNKISTKNELTPFQVRTADHVRWLADNDSSKEKWSSGFAAKDGFTIQQGLDIDMSNNSFMIANLAATYDGNGKTLYKLNHTFINELQNTGVVKNLTIDTINTQASESAAFVSSIVESTSLQTAIENVSLKNVTMKYLGADHVGIINEVNEQRKIENLSVSNSSISTAASGAKYASIIAEVNGAGISGLTVKDTTLKQENNRYSAVIGFCNTSLELSGIHADNLTTNGAGLIYSYKPTDTAGKLKDSILENSKVDLAGVIQEVGNKGIQLIENVQVINSTIGGAGFIGELTSTATIQNNIIQDSTIAGDGFIGTASGTSEQKLLNNTVQNCTIAGNGFAGTTVKSTTINNGSVSSTSIGKNGFVGSNSGTIQNSSVSAVKDDEAYKPLTIKGNGFAGTNETDGSIQGCRVENTYKIGTDAEDINSEDSITSGNGFVGINKGKIDRFDTGEKDSEGKPVYKNNVVSVVGTIYGNGFAGNNVDSYIRYSGVTVSEEKVLNTDFDSTQDESETNPKYVTNEISIQRNGFAENNTYSGTTFAQDKGEIRYCSVHMSGTIGMNGFIGTNGTDSNRVVRVTECSVSGTDDHEDVELTRTLVIGAMEDGTLRTNDTGNGFAGINYGSLLQDVITSGSESGTINGNGFLQTNYGTVKDAKIETLTYLNEEETSVTVPFDIQKYGFADMNETNANMNDCTVDTVDDTHIGWGYSIGKNTGSVTECKMNGDPFSEDTGGYGTAKTSLFSLMLFQTPTNEEPTGPKETGIPEITETPIPEETPEVSATPTPSIEPTEEPEVEPTPEVGVVEETSSPIPTETADVEG